MVKTPIQSELKSNPYITKSTSKSLLTPCGRVGLSRKRKTPSNNNSLTESPCAVVDTTPLRSNILTTEETTPGRVSKCLSSGQATQSAPCYRVGLSRKRKTPSANNSFSHEISLDSLDTTPVSSNILTTEENTPCTNGNKSKKSRVSKCLISEQAAQSETEFHKLDVELLEDSTKNDSNSPKRIEIETCDTDSTSDERDRLSTVIDDDEAFQAEVEVHSSKRKCIETKKKNSPKGAQKSKSKTKMTKDYPKDNIDDDFDMESVSHFKNKHKVNLITKVENTPDPTALTKSEAIPLGDRTNKVKEVDKLSDSTREKQKNRKIRRSLSMKKSSEEKEPCNRTVNECSVNLCPLEVSDQSKANTLEDLKEQIQKKQQLVAEYKQAEIIKKKHDLKELQEVTALWKTGCISALNDLLPLLQEDVNIDMETLLRNLNVPEEMISCSQNGNLI